jgi:membrane-associated protease RseP (regulator of RpoE activity)
LGASPFDPLETVPPAEPSMPVRAYIPPPMVPARRRERVWVPPLLVVLTALTTTVAGADAHGSLWNGAIYSACILAILGAHEMGHYLACLYYRIDASKPHFLPAPDVLWAVAFGPQLLLKLIGVPWVVITGTFGAFIRIRQPITGKRELFDVGIAGPIAGFLVALPILFFGVAYSPRVPILPGSTWFGEPLLMKLAIWLVHGPLPAGQTIATHPMLFAAWFGLIATSLNLFPIGQLDGGHISYAVLGRVSTYVTLASVAILVVLTFVSYSWLLWAVLTVVMLIVFGPAHPRTLDEDVPLDPTRMWLAVFALAMFILSFTPVPIDIIAAPGR